MVFSRGIGRIARARTFGAVGDGANWSNGGARVGGVFVGGRVEDFGDSFSELSLFGGGPRRNRCCRVRAFTACKSGFSCQKKSEESLDMC